MVDLSPIRSERLSLVAMSPELLAIMCGQPASDRPFDWPTWWPDATDRGHLTMWRARATEAAVNIVWGPRAIVDANREMVGHGGFHLPPQSLERALGDPSFVGKRDPAAGGVVEVGYTIFPAHRHHGYATEAVEALISWAETTGDVAAVLASIAEDNAPSARVLERVGGFVMIGKCRNDDQVVEAVFRRDL